MKTCCKCKLNMSLDKFSIDRSRKDGRQTECKVCRRERFDTVEKSLKRTYKNILHRCNNDKSYVEKGITCRFTSFWHFYYWIVCIMFTDPRGKQCHRPDNDGDYEPGNIEFLDPEEHRQVHAEMDAEEIPF